MGYPAFTFRRSLWKKRGGVDASLRIASDVEFLCWLCLQGNALVLLRPGYARRDHAANLSTSPFSKPDCVLDWHSILTRYIPRCSALQADEAELRRLRGSYRFAGYWMKQAGRYRIAAKIMLLDLRVWGLNGFALAQLAKIIPHMLLTGLTGTGRGGPYQGLGPAEPAARAGC
jgi:hypothetical protein